MSEGKDRVVVTGASSGIGKVYADRLAKRGHDLLLIARRKDRLEEIKADLESRYGARIEIVAADLSVPEQLDAVADRLASDHSISTLINNAGTSVIGALSDMSAEQLAKVVQLNVVALSRLTMAILPRLKVAKNGSIVNIGSVVAFDGFPYGSIYGGSKAYVQIFTRALQAELTDSGVYVQLVAPAATVSEIWDVQGYPLSAVDPRVVMTTEDLVDAALTGFDRRESVTVPSVQDEKAVANYFEGGAALFRDAQNGKPAPRYTA